MKWLLVLIFVVGLPFGLAFFAGHFVDGATLDRGISWLREATDSLAPTLPSPKPKPMPRPAKAVQAKNQASPSVPVVVNSAKQAKHLPVAIRDQRPMGAPMEKLDQKDRDRLSAIIAARISK